jgi:long-chain fatty acid transport protein
MNKKLSRLIGVPERSGPVRRAAILPALFAVGAVSCFGAAFSIGELGDRAAGMGTAFIATADDGSALFYNPAGIAFQPGRKMEMDSLVVVGLFRFTPSSTPVGQVVPADGYSGSIKPHFIPVASLYATQQYNDKITFGFGVFTPFGLAANFTNFNDSDPDLTKFVGRFAGTRAQLQEYWFQPTVAYKITPNSSFAVGPAFVHTHLLIEKSILNPQGDGLTFGDAAASEFLPSLPQAQAAAILARLLPEGRSRLAGTANEAGYSAGWLYKRPGGKTRIGLMWRSAVTNHLNGKASFALGPTTAIEAYLPPNFLFNAFPNQNITGSFTTPATYGVGFANSSFWNTTIAVDVRLQDYHRFSSVPVDFPINNYNNSNIAITPEQRLYFNFHDAFAVAVGAEKPLSPTLTVRLGFLFDQSPVPDKSVGPLFPDSDRLSFTAGASKKSGDKEFTLFYEAMHFENRVTNVAANDNIYTNGDYHSFAHLAGASFRFNLGDLVTIKKH